jgi:hypothetical protein
MWDECEDIPKQFKPDQWNESCNGTHLRVPKKSSLVPGDKEVIILIHILNG